MAESPSAYAILHELFHSDDVGQPHIVDEQILEDIGAAYQPQRVKYIAKMQDVGAAQASINTKFLQTKYGNYPHYPLSSPNPVDGRHLTTLNTGTDTGLFVQYVGGICLVSETRENNPAFNRGPAADDNDYPAHYIASSKEWAASSTVVALTIPAETDVAPSTTTIADAGPVTSDAAPAASSSSPPFNCKWGK
ncbi:hypothetical protein MMC21_006743 [Puttea exsequens]|nr:hypothetical protein [Puttea exsequens]